MHSSLIVLGPQRPEPNLAQVLDNAGIDGPVALLSAGWRHDEAEYGPLQTSIGRRVVPVPLYAWFDQVAREEPELTADYRERQRKIMLHKELYRIRCFAALRAVHDLLERVDDEPELVRPELEHALDDVRRIDDEMLQAQEAIRASFEQLSAPWDVPQLAHRHAEAEQILAETGAVLVAGGHVAVLLNRVRLFGLDLLLRNRVEQGLPVVCWSAGAMIMTERIALFYDDPPEGPSEAEVLDTGLGLLPGVVLLPHARQRLRLDRPDRVARLAHRFAPAIPLTLENGAWLRATDEGWRNGGVPGTVCCLCTEGCVTAVEAP